MIRQLVGGALMVATSVALAGQTPAQYDRAAEKAITGTIKAVAAYPTPDGAVGVHLDLKTADGIVSVHVGPATYVGQQNFWFFAEDKVEVVGARVPYDENTPVWAKAVIKGSAILVLRNDDGTPKWTPATNGTDGCGVTHAPVPRSTEF